MQGNKEGSEVDEVSACAEARGGDGTAGFQGRAGSKGGAEDSGEAEPLE